MAGAPGFIELHHCNRVGCEQHAVYTRRLHATCGRHTSDSSPRGRERFLIDLGRLWPEARPQILQKLFVGVNHHFAQDMDGLFALIHTYAERCL